MAKADVLVITGGLVMSTSFALEEEEDDDDDTSAVEALFTNPAIEVRSAAVPSSIAAVLLALAVGRGRGTIGLVFSTLSGTRAGVIGTLGRRLGF
jgi:hypothetical protein